MSALPRITDPVVSTTPRLPTRQPVGAAVLAWAVYVASLVVWLVLPWDRGTGSAGEWVMTLGVYLTRIVVVAGFLTVWRLWRPAGFRTAPTWRRLVPALPLLLLPGYQLAVGPGMPDRPAWQTAVVAFGTLTVAFGEEGLFRGVVLRVLLARGVRPAVFGAAALFGLMHVVNLFTSAHPIGVLAQVLMTFGVGIGFGAVALATGTIWPLLIIHFFMDVGYSIQAAAPSQDTGTDMADLLLNAGIAVALGLLTAGYGLWLVRRRVGLLRQLENQTT